MLKGIITLSFLFISSLSAAIEVAESFQTLSSIDEALEKATLELTTLKIDTFYLESLKDYYKLYLTDAVTGDFVKYYLVGTCDLHEVLALADALQSNTAILVPDEALPNYLAHNREFFDRFLDLFYEL
jgi:hypothetical protein